MPQLIDRLGAMQPNRPALHLRSSDSLSFESGESSVALLPYVRVDPDERRGGDGLPMPITREQYRAILAAARSIDHRLLIQTLWQTGGRIGEVLHLRPCDLSEVDGSIHLPNEKQRRRENRSKTVYVSRDLVAELQAFARGVRLKVTRPFFRSARSGTRSMSRCQAWRIVTDCAERAGVLVPGQRGELVPASPLNFRHGSAVHQIREGVPLTEVQRQLGHSRLSSTVVYLRLTDPERRAIADRVAW